MPSYSYTAANASGKTVRGKLTASNDLDLEQRLNGMGLIVINFNLIKHSASGFRTRVNAKEIIMFCVHLEQLDRAGVPILDSLADLRDTIDSPTFRDVVSDIYENIKGGDVLSGALAKRPDVFSSVFIGLVAAGEKTGRLSEAFKHLAEHYKWNNDLQRSIKKAMTYPIILILLMVGVVSLMMLFVVPKLVDFLTAQGFDLPMYTRALIWTSNAFANYWWLIFGLPTASIIALLIFYRTSTSFRYVVDKIILKLPFIGQVVLKINLARFAHFFSVTFNSGIGILECLETARNVVGNSVIKESVYFIIQSVAEGNSITRAIAATRKFPSLVVRMFKVGEDSGNMEEALKNINFFYDREVKDSVNGMIEVIQPALTVVMGGVMFWVVAAVFGPLYNNFSKMDF